MSQMTVQKSLSQARSYKMKPTSSQLTRQEVPPKPQSSVDTESVVPPKYTTSTHSSKLCPHCPLNVYSTWTHSALVTRSCPTLRDPMDHSTPGSSVHGILQARILEWVAISFSTWTHRLHLKTAFPNTSLVVQWLGLCTCNARGVASIPSWVTMIPHASRHGQKIKNNNNIAVCPRSSLVFSSYLTQSSVPVVAQRSYNKPKP